MITSEYKEGEFVPSGHFYSSTIFCLNFYSNPCFLD